jgi:hypothetical protein
MRAKTPVLLSSQGRKCWHRDPRPRGSPAVAARRHIMKRAAGMRA